MCVNLGKNQLPINVSAIINRGGIRLGLEDNIYFDEEQKVQASNLQLLE
ncbi:3-keto-5-aminohexanoate cleavage protein [uncultured Draconibacterium sp.]